MVQAKPGLAGLGGLRLFLESPAVPVRPWTGAGPDVSQTTPGPTARFGSSSEDQSDNRRQGGPRKAALLRPSSLRQQQDQLRELPLSDPGFHRPPDNSPGTTGEIVVPQHAHRPEHRTLQTPLLGRPSQQPGTAGPAADQISGRNEPGSGSPRNRTQRRSRLRRPVPTRVQIGCHADGNRQGARGVPADTDLRTIPTGSFPRW